MTRDLPIIHISGLPGAGKTTLAEKISKELKLPIYRIGSYRVKFPSTTIGEADAWIRLFYDLSRRGWKNCILETTGLNRREHFIETLPMYNLVTIKLNAGRNILYKRIAKKNKSERGNRNWLYGREYRDKYEFVKKSFGVFKRVHAHIEINTATLRLYEVYKTALRELRLFGIYG